MIQFINLGIRTHANTNCDIMFMNFILLHQPIRRHGLLTLENWIHKLI